MTDTPTTTEELVRALASSLVVRWGTTAPFHIGPVRFERVGFAAIPTVAVTVHCRPEHTRDLVPIVRSRVFGELAERGWENTVVDLKPMVQQNRRRRFTDSNEESPSFGRAKFGNEHRFTFEIVDPELKTATRSGGTYQPLPDRRSV